MSILSIFGFNKPSKINKMTPPLTPHLGMIIGYRLTDEELKSNINNNQEVAPAIVTSTFPNEYGEGVEGIGVNCHVLLDGLDTIWKTSLKFGTEKGEYYQITQE